MSLINDMLRDLEHRKDGDGNKKVNGGEAVAPGRRDNRRLRMAIYLTVIILSLMAWSAVRILNRLDAGDGSVVSAQPRQEVVPKTELPALKLPEQTLNSNTGQDANEKMSAADSDAVVAVEATVLSSLVVLNDQSGARIGLDFERSPDYRILQNGSGVAPLVINFSNVQLDGAFEVPDLDDSLIGRISFLPLQGSLQLLVDIDERVKVQGIEMVKRERGGARMNIAFAVAESGAMDRVEPAQPAASAKRRAVDIPEDAAMASAPPVGEKDVGVRKVQELVPADVAAYNRGMEYLSQADYDSARSHFNIALTHNPALDDARMRLADLMIQAGEFQAAEVCFADGLELDPENLTLRKHYSRFLVDQQRAEEALTVLRQRQSPELLEDLEFHALEAALLQETARYDEAAQLYERLLSVRPEKALWWLGLGVAREQLGQHPQARAAYESAATLPGLKPGLLAYIQGRLDVL